MFSRPVIDSQDFALKGSQLSGEVPISELARMSDLLTDAEGALSYDLIGGEDGSGNPVLQLKLEGQCHLRCQRCLKPMDYLVELSSALKLVKPDDLEEETLDDDEMDSIPAEKQLDVWSLIEDELLLSLPISPRHDEGVCQMAGGAGAQKTNPFSVLSGIKVVK